MAAMNMNEKLFNEMIQGDKPVLVDFWAPGAVTAAASLPLTRSWPSRWATKWSSPS